LKRQLFLSPFSFWQRLLGRERDGEVELAVELPDVGVFRDSAAMASLAETWVMPTITHEVAMALKISTELLHGHNNTSLAFNLVRR
jgi:hypothetical protein